MIPQASRQSASARRLTLAAVAISFSLIAGCALPKYGLSSKLRKDPTFPAWFKKLDGEIAKLGSYNWIVIAEPSFPSLSREGIATLTIPATSPEALDVVFQSIESNGHVKARIYLTRESTAIIETESPGIKAFRGNLKTALHGREPEILTQDALEILLTDAKKKHRVLVLKTSSSLPYSSIFLELESGYWDSESETSLRKRLNR